MKLILEIYNAMTETSILKKYLMWFKVNDYTYIISFI